MVSVVIAAHARAERLRVLLDSLAGEREVVVAADGAADAVHAVLAESDVRVVRLDPGRGPAAARNAGWRAATGDLIAFTDDDCRAAPGWTDALAAAADADRAIVQGRVVAEPGPVGPFSRTLSVAAAGPFYQTANMLYPRAVLERLGGFDEAFPAPAGEDTDLGWRALAAGVAVRWAPDALIHHAIHEPGWRGLVRDAPRWGSAIRLVAKHPGIRAHFHHRYFWKPSHERLLLAAAGVALARRTRGASLAALAPWLALHRADGAGLLPAHLLVDAAEVAALARGSVRAKTLLL